jgi:hypothetical protein
VLRKRPGGLLDGEISGGRAMMERLLEDARAKELLYMIPRPLQYGFVRR